MIDLHRVDSVIDIGHAVLRHDGGDVLRAVEAAVDENRDQTLEQIAKRFQRRPAIITQVLRLNYPASDIIAAIMDGRQPPALDRQKLVFASLPTDWEQQRALLGFFGPV